MQEEFSQLLVRAKAVVLKSIGVETQFRMSLRTQEALA